MIEVKQILFATDYSGASLHALQFASWLAHCACAKLLIVHVSDVEEYPIGELFADSPLPDHQELARLQAIVPADSTIPVEHHLLHGEPGSVERVKPAKAILAFARQHDVDMIVLGTHGRRGLSHLLMGSVAESVMHEADCPVVTVRQGTATRGNAAHFQAARGGAAGL